MEVGGRDNQREVRVRGAFRKMSLRKILFQRHMIIIIATLSCAKVKRSSERKNKRLGMLRREGSENM